MILPHVNRACLPLLLDEIASRYPHNNIVMVLEGAGWHKNQTLQLPDNLRLLFLPPYAPELNPQEHVWDELREKFFHHRTFYSLHALESPLCHALNQLASDPARLLSLSAWDWIINSVPN